MVEKTIEYYVKLSNIFHKLVSHRRELLQHMLKEKKILDEKLFQDMLYHPEFLQNDREKLLDLIGLDHTTKNTLRWVVERNAKLYRIAKEQLEYFKKQFEREEKYLPKKLHKGISKYFKEIEKSLKQNNNLFSEIESYYKKIHFFLSKKSFREYKRKVFHTENKYIYHLLISEEKKDAKTFEKEEHFMYQLKFAMKEHFEDMSKAGAIMLGFTSITIGLLLPLFLMHSNNNMIKIEADEAVKLGAGIIAGFNLMAIKQSVLFSPFAGFVKSLQNTFAKNEV